MPIPTLPVSLISILVTPAGINIKLFPELPISAVPEGSLNSMAAVPSVLSNLAVTFGVPEFTCNFLPGEPVPIPTSPSVAITKSLPKLAL